MVIAQTFARSPIFSKCLLALFASVFLLFTPAPRLRAEPTPSEGSPTSLITIHYHRFDGDYELAGLWTWDGRDQKNPADQEVLSAGRDGYGVYFHLDPSQYGNDNGAGERIGFIPRLRRDWNAKDGSDRYWTPALGREIWLIGNDPKIYTEPPDTTPRISHAFVDAPNLLTLKLSHGIALSEVTPAHFSVSDGKGALIPVKSAKAAGTRGPKATIVELELDYALDLKHLDYEVAGAEMRPARLEARRILDHPQLFKPDVPMGVTLSADSTTFRLFSPMADEAAVVLYDSPTGDAGRREIPMEAIGKGAWEATVPQNLEGKFYRLKTTTSRGTHEAVDPMAVNTTGHDGAARITDVRAQDPEGFRPVKRPDYGDSPTDAIIYEIHIRDFTSDKASGVPVEKRGKYLGFVHSDATVNGNGSLKAGIDHLKELGVTHVQILPPQDFDNNETNPGYSWGYMTAFFNSPDGWFASNPRNESRVREFKEMVKALHDAGIGVIIDVVYNHTGTQATFELLAPGYYHRMRDDGSFWNGSGTGNELRTEAPMVRQFIADSCKYWVDEYGVDGFRFDLMGLIDLETMKELTKEVKDLYPQALVYGEPWLGGVGPEGAGVPQPLFKDKVKNSGFGAFNDHFRNALKGQPDGDSPGYVQNGGHRDAIKTGIAGSIDDWAAHPWESVNYATCHDNLTLWDKLHISAAGKSEEDYRRMQMLTGGILAVSQGVLFYNGGVELARTKGGNHNSYNAGDEVNQIQWERKGHFADLFNFHKGAIALRRDHPLFRLSTAEEVRKRLKFHDQGRPAAETIVFTVDGEGLAGEEWKQAAVFINPTPQSQTFVIPSEEEFGVYVLDTRAGTDMLQTVRGEIVVGPRSMAVLGR